MQTVTGISADADADGSHRLELADGSEVTIPADKIGVVTAALQNALARRVFDQSQRLDRPTESSLALTELHILRSASATKGRATTLACNLAECGWVSFVADGDQLRQLREKIDEVLRDAAGPYRAN